MLLNHKLLSSFGTRDYGVTLYYMWSTNVRDTKYDSTTYLLIKKLIGTAVQLVEDFHEVDMMN